MFGRKTCRNCNRNLKKDYSFCPYCGNQLENKEENMGMLGKSDSLTGTNDSMMPPGFNMIFNSLLRNLEKQFRDLDKKNEKVDDNKKNNISISISTFGNMPSPVIKMNPIPQEVQHKAKKHDDIKKFFFNNFSIDKLKKFSKLPREEPKSNIRRLSNKIIYEVELPGVKSVKDISIINLEKNLEIKALSEKKAYLKSVPMNLPIINYKLSKGKFILEFDARDN